MPSAIRTPPSSLRRLATARVLAALMACGAPGGASAGDVGDPQLFDVRIFYSVPGHAPAMGDVQLHPGARSVPVGQFQNMTPGAPRLECTADLVGPERSHEVRLSCRSDTTPLACLAALALSETGTGAASVDACGEPAQGKISIFVHPARPGGQ